MFNQWLARNMVWLLIIINMAVPIRKEYWECTGSFRCLLSCVFWWNNRKSLSPTEWVDLRLAPVIRPSTRTGGEQTCSNGISIASIVRIKLFCSQHICMTMLCDFKIVKLHAFWVCFQSIFIIPIYHTTITFPRECLQFLDCSIKDDRFTICWHIPSSRWSDRPAVVWCSAQIILYYGVTHLGCFLRSSLHSNTLWW